MNAGLSEPLDTMSPQSLTWRTLSREQFPEWTNHTTCWLTVSRNSQERSRYAETSSQLPSRVHATVQKPGSVRDGQIVRGAQQAFEAVQALPNDAGVRSDCPVVRNGRDLRTQCLCMSRGLFDADAKLEPLKHHLKTRAWKAKYGHLRQQDEL